MTAFDRCMTFTLDAQNDGQPFHVTPGDAGGATAYGITLAVLSHHLGHRATFDNLKHLPPVVRAAIYENDFWNPIHCGNMPSGVDLMVFDHAVTCGPGPSARLLQGVVHVSPDGVVGPYTLAALRHPAQIVDDLSRVQLAHYHALPGWREFGHGWEARLFRRKAAAQAMLAPVAEPVA